MPLPKPPGENPLDRLVDGPEPTRREKAELAEIDPAVHHVYEKTVRRWWYAQVAIGMFFVLSVEYALWATFGWWAILPAVVLLPYLHEKKWDRQTDYGALAEAKLAENPSSEWNRQRLREKRRERTLDS